MYKPFFIVGPTSVGKTTLAIALAERLGAEIVGADAFQVYEGFDLLSAKPSPVERQRVPHHLIGMVPVSATYDVAQYIDDARQVFERIEQRGRRALVVGGSGLYIKALTHGLSPLPPAQPRLREELERWELGDLAARLRKLDPAATETVDLRNKRRVVRAVEVCLATGGKFSDFQNLWKRQPAVNGPLGIFLHRDKPDLEARIKTRVDRMFAQDVLGEVRASPLELLSPTASKMIGLPEIRACLAGEMDLNTCRERIVQNTRRFAKRQMTWFRGEHCFDAVHLPSTLGDERWLEGVADRLERAIFQP